MKEFFKKHQQRIWKWSVIVLVCLLAFSTCLNCYQKQRSAWVDKRHPEVVDSLDLKISELKRDLDSVTFDLEKCESDRFFSEMEIEFLNSIKERLLYEYRRERLLYEYQMKYFSSLTNNNIY